ncbi:hypothetical protein [Sphingomonas mollis]|uniref:Uncharacterized protein n=1 Tax=Sphingomonas mollis TaxID=2795726 RepID=A0ABS0XRV3_9SPHN|nr:hypothetical protein [Sphingomonas sp. BT553]MBJ6122756.1 hypothetical protein [Sphingomonas sp. BT553]
MPQINWTQTAGLTGFALAAIFCWRAAGRQRGPWRLLAIFYAVLCGEIVAGIRHTLLRTMGGIFGLGSYYMDRRPVQLAALAILIGLAVWLAWRTMRTAARRPGARPARIVALVAAGLFAAEIVSLHQVDAVMYRRIGPVMLIGWLWLACGVVAAIIAVGARPTRKRRSR